MRILVSGGGSGGHIYPALSVAAQLQEEYQAEILYLGSNDGLEAELAPAAGFPYAMVKAGKLQRYVSWKTVTGVARVPLGVVQAIGIVRDFRPQAAFTSGGYVSVPAGLAARVNGVPLLMHQQDVPVNLSNKLLAPLATRISVAFEDSRASFPAQKTLWLGNPVRQAILDIRQETPQQARSSFGFEAERPLILVTGGSQGARHLNQVTCRALPALLERWQVLQISGKKLFAETQQAAEQAMSGLDETRRTRYRLVPYLDAEMPRALQAADVVVCRAGASTLSELAALSKPSILVPLPPAIGSSPQEANAAMFERKGAALVAQNDALTPELLVDYISRVLTSEGERMAQAVSLLAKLDATREIAAAVVALAGVQPSREEKSVLI